jgi:polar amino acid transport system permease protein
LSGGKETILAVLLNWSPYIFKGFAINVFISIVSMALATILGLVVGVGQISMSRGSRWVCWAFTNFFRNAPWLVVLFYCMLLLPFQFRVGGVVVAVPDWAKATLGIAIAAAANMSDLVRGAIQSISTGQWESAESLAFTRRQTLFLVILPQCIKRLLPPWMNLYALVMVSTPLCAIVGVNEIMTVAADILAANTRHDLLIPLYFYILLLFFLYCYPIARMTQRLERRFAVIG